MTSESIAAVLGAVFVTAVVSGAFGMAGGLLLMGVLTFALPVAAAMAVHGITQVTSNAARVVLHIGHVRWRTTGVFGIGAVVAMAVFGAVVATPSKAVVFLGLGLLPIAVWLPERWVGLDPTRPAHSLAAGFVSTAVSLVTGISGPLTDLFLTQGKLTRHQMVATKASLQIFGHLAKIVVYGGAILGGDAAAAPWPLIAGAAVLAVAGATLGGRVLDRFSDEGFRKWRRWIFTAIGVTYLIQGARLFWGA